MADTTTSTSSTTRPPVPPPATTQAADARDAHLRAMVAHHFSPETGTPFWIDWANEHRLDAAAEIMTLDDLKKLPRFEDEWLRKLPHAAWIPRAYASRPFKIFETGGTTGMPKQRLSWDDHLTDYSEFSERGSRKGN